MSHISSPSSGKSWQDKVKDLRDEMVKQNAAAFIVTSLDEIACKWFILYLLSLTHTHARASRCVFHNFRIKLIK